MRPALVVVAAALVASLVFAQTKGQAPSPPGEAPIGTLHLQTSIGSFKILGVANLPASGKVDVQFTGSILISDLEGDLAISPGLVKEYLGHGKQVYFGTGTVTVNGRFRSVQWFGRDMKATWVGRGVIRLYGEFDNNLQTGDAWFDDASRKVPWGQGGLTLELPDPTRRTV